MDDNSGSRVNLKVKKGGYCCGGGVVLSGGSKELRELAENAEIPVTMTLMGLGSFPGKHTLSLGMPGMQVLIMQIRLSRSPTC